MPIIAHHYQYLTDYQDSYVEEVVRYSLKWSINEFSQFRRNVGDYVSSSIFPTGENSKHKWQIRAYPYGDTQVNNNFLTVDVHLASVSSDVELPVRAKVEMSLIDNTNKETNTVSWLAEFKKLDDGMGQSRFINTNNLLHTHFGMLPGDKLTLTCKLDVYTGHISEAQINTCRLPNDLGNIFQSQLLSDVDIVVADREFKAHKLILAARSPVFRAMFSHNMRESQLGRVEISDVEPEVFEQLLRYIYTGNSIWLESIIDKIVKKLNKKSTSQFSFAMKLFKAACKYQLDDLKLTCEHQLHKLISVESVVEILSMVDQYQAVHLKRGALEFAIFHAGELTQMGAWKVLAKQSPEILADILARQCPAPSKPSESTQIDSARLRR